MSTLHHRDAHLQSVWTPLTLDESTKAWLEAAAPAWWRGFLVAPLQWLGFNGPDIDALLGTGRMHVLSAGHCATLLGPYLPHVVPEGGGAAAVGGGAAATAPKADAHTLSVLDIGAGSGEVTQALASGLQQAQHVQQATGPREVQVTATDSSAACVRALNAKGFQGVHCDSIDASDERFAAPGQFHVVACLNVLDRCREPRALLWDALRLCADGGLLVFALVLPWDDFVEVGGVQQKPAEPLPMGRYRCGDGPGLEACLGGFLRNVLGVLPGATGDGPLVPQGTLTLRSVSRVPYLAEGDLFAPMYWLPNAIVVCSKGGKLVDAM